MRCVSQWGSRWWAGILVVYLLAPGTALAQANLFNVPSGDITDVDEVFFQQQMNLTRLFGQSNTTIDYGLWQDFEVGLNFLDVSIYDESVPAPFDSHSQVSPDLMFNCQQGFQPFEWWKIGVGTQIGFNPPNSVRSTRLLNFSWLVNEFTIPDERGKVHIGAYVANHPYAGPGELVGLMAGGEIPIIKDRFSLMADVITGNNDLAVAVLGGVWELPRRWQFSAGIQIPTVRSQAFSGVVFELTRTGSRQKTDE